MAGNIRLRPLGLLERFHAARHFWGHDTCVVTSVKYAAEDRAILTREVLFSALQQVIHKLAPLGVKLEGKSTSKTTFSRLRSIDLTRVVEFSDGKDLQAELQSQLTRGFDVESNLPLWRIAVLGDNTVIFAFHHTVGDGLSSLAFHASLFQALQNPQTGGDSFTVQVPDIPLLLPIESITNVRPSGRQIISQARKVFAPASAKFAWTGNAVPKVASLRPNVRLISFAPREAAAFLDSCRAQHATISSALYCLAVATLSRMVPTHYKTISAMVAISLREVADIPGSVMGDYVSMHHTCPPVDPVFSWDAAARYAVELQTQKRRARGLVGMLALLFGNYAGYMNKRLGTKREAGVLLSNLGRFNVPETEGKWRMETTFFTQCDVVSGAAFKINVIGDPGGALNISLTWGDFSISTEFVEAFSSQFQEAFRTLISQMISVDT
ncbi:alcohol acetyltransferase [Mycena rebaudengoi]|nr:alcohol acetyltransferase [Mycena rebaudengoi]